ncbi:MAG: Na/Pi symporter [Acidobacteriota bacterium]|jgi:solute carrier family 34 (sodium-dependent phosphate cotransporter)
MSDRANPQAAADTAIQFFRNTAVRVIALLAVLYGFLVSIGMIGKAFKMFSGGFVGELIQSASNPLIGLFVGILVTSLVQSSSTTTSLVVALVGSGTMPVATAIPVVMGANIGTSVTNILVSLGHINRGREFRRAYAAANVHDFFNVLAVLILFPLQLATNFLGVLSTQLAEVFYDIGGLTFASPLKLATAPAVNGAAHLIGQHPWLMLLVSLVLMFASLRQLVVLLKLLVMSRVEVLFDEVIFRNAGRAMLFGLFITALVQSSSVTTSLAVPLAGAGILTIEQIFPYTLGANVGTTITAMLAALAVGEVPAVTVAFAHMLFNICGILVIWPLPAMRNLPIQMAEKMTQIAMRSRIIPVAWVLFFFFVMPAMAIFLLR